MSYILELLSLAIAKLIKVCIRLLILDYMKIAIIVPAYNEELTLLSTLKDIRSHLPEAEIYVIDNNSTDQTNAIAKQFFKANPETNGEVLFEAQQGKAFAVRRAFTQINADIYVMVDADSTYPMHSVRALIRPVTEGNCDMVVGDRQSNGLYQNENKRKFHQFGNQLVNSLINFLFKANLKDIMSGYRVFSKRFVKNYPILSNGFELETEMTLHALDKRFRIIEIPIDFKDRPQGSSSKLNTFQDGARVLKMIFSIFKDYRPLSFFCSAAAIFMLFGLIVGYPVMLEFIETHYIHKVPSAILATGFMLISFISLNIGVILDTCVKIHHFNYELRLLNFRSN